MQIRYIYITVSYRVIHNKNAMTLGFTYLVKDVEKIKMPIFEGEMIDD